jgi:phosphate transport system substrate-binding protein
MNVKIFKVFGAVLISAALAGSTASAQADAVDKNLPDYKATQGVSGTLKSMGSDTMNNLMTEWANEFKKFHPNVKVEVEGKGSSSAPTALVAGSADFGPMSREMKQKEIDEFEKKFGYKPTSLQVALDVLSVYVHKDNPIKGMTLAQADAIFSKTRKAGAPSEVVRWSDLGLTGDWASLPLSLYGRNAASGTYGFFKEHVLLNGDYKDSVKETPGSSAVVQGVATDKGGVGYSGIGYKTPDVKAVPLAKKDGKPFVEPTMANAYSGDYPLTRFLLVYMNVKPGAAPDPLRTEFVRFIYSKQGQQVVAKDGYIPLMKPVADRNLAPFAAPAAK